MSTFVILHNNYFFLIGFSTVRWRRNVTQKRIEGQGINAFWHSHMHANAQTQSNNTATAERCAHFQFDLEKDMSNHIFFSCYCCQYVYSFAWIELFVSGRNFVIEVMSCMCHTKLHSFTLKCAVLSAISCTLYNNQVNANKCECIGEQWMSVYNYVNYD